MRERAHELPSIAAMVVGMHGRSVRRRRVEHEILLAHVALLRLPAHGHDAAATLVAKVRRLISERGRSCAVERRAVRDGRVGREEPHQLLASNLTVRSHRRGIGGCGRARRRRRRRRCRRSRRADGSEPRSVP